MEAAKIVNLYDLNETEEQMIAKKKICVQPPRCMQVKNGKLHPCDFGTALYGLNIGRYEMDYVDIENTPDTAELKKKIHDFIDQPYYRTCGHCRIGGIADRAGCFSPGQIIFRQKVSGTERILSSYAEEE